jgi:asparagine synthase (glutamine-hydrolysing)
MDRFFFHFDKPRLNLCNGVWLDAINEEAKRRGLTVLLTAQLGNMSMSYAGDHLFAELAARFRLGMLAREGLAAWRRGTRLGTIAAASIGPFLPRPLWKAIARVRGKGGLGWHSSIRFAAAVGDDFRRRAEAADMDFAAQPLRSGAHWRLRTLRRFDSGMDNKGALAAFGIDIRDPMTDRALIELCLRVPLDEYLKDGVFRSLARRTLADRIPAAIVAGTARGYQWADWTEGVDAARPQIEAELTRSADLKTVAANIDTERLRALVEAWPENWSDPAHIDPYRHVLLRAVSAAHFVRRVEGGNA